MKPRKNERRGENERRARRLRSRENNKEIKKKVEFFNKELRAVRDIIHGYRNYLANIRPVIEWMFIHAESNINITQDAPPAIQAQYKDNLRQAAEFIKLIKSL